MYWLYDRYNMYAFSLVNSINKIMKTLSFYKFSLLLLCNSAPWNRWSWMMDYFPLRDQQQQPIAVGICVGSRLPGSKSNFSSFPLLLSKWRYLFQPFDGGRGSRKSIFSSTRAGRWNFNELGRRGLQLERYLQAVPVGSVRHASPRWPGSAVGAVNMSGSLGRDCSEAFCQVSCIVPGICRGLWHAAFRYCFPHTLKFSWKKTAGSGSALHVEAQKTDDSRATARNGRIFSVFSLTVLLSSR